MTDSQTSRSEAKEFRIFEVDKYDNKFFVCRHSNLESAKYWLKKVGVTGSLDENFIIEDELGEKYQ